MASSRECTTCGMLLGKDPEYRAAQVARRAILIYEESLKEAEDSWPEHLESGDDHMWLRHSTRGAAAAFFASEYGCAFTQVRVTREYMRISRDAIRDSAADTAAEGWEDGDPIPIAYTWPDEGWLFETCGPKDPGSLAFWRCEEKPRAAHLQGKGS